MFILWIVSLIICITILYILRTSKVQHRERRNSYEYWKDSTWNDLGKFVLPRVFIFLYIVVSIIPLINIICAIVSIVWLCKNLSCHSGSDSYALEEYRIVPESKLINWLFEKI